jgi:hypothetical protein
MRTTIGILGALLALGLITSPASAACEGTAETSALGESSDMISEEPSAMIPDNEFAGVPDRLVGQVLALDVEQGSLLLGTDAGAIALRGSPEQMEGLEIGDTVEVVLDESLERPEQI